MRLAGVYTAGILPLATLLLLAIGTSRSSAQSIGHPRDGAISTGHSSLEVNGHTTATGSLSRIPVLSSSAVATYNRFDSLPNCFSFYTLASEPFVFDPVSGILAIIKRGSGFAGESGNDIYIRTSSDMGVTWGAPIGPLHDVGTLGNGRYPTMKILHVPGSSDPNEILFFYTFPTTVSDAFGNFVSGIVGPDGTSIVPATNDPGVGSETWVSDSRVIVSKANDALVVAGTLSNNNVGLRRYDLVTSTFGTSIIPPQWAGTKFVPAGTPGSRTSTIAGVGNDDANVFYAGIYARFPSMETGTRRVHPYPSVSKSTDKGLTWSECAIVPVSTITDYIAQEMPDANPDSTFFSYTAEDFIVEPNGTCHFALNFFEADRTKSETAAHLVELTLGSNGWRMRKVSDISGRNFLYITATDTTNQTSNEVQIASTVDHTKLLTKWVDLVSFVFTDDIDGDAVAPDTLVTSDVFVSVRVLGGGGNWSPSINATETPWLDKISWIPSTIPNDLISIPALEMHTIPPVPPTSLRDSIFDQQRVIDIPAYVAGFSINAAAGAGVDTRTTAASGLRLYAPNPNPVNDRALVTFTLPKAGNVRIDLFDLAGEKIRTVFDGSLEAGNRGVVLATADLAAGTYFYTMTHNGETLSRSMTVVK